MGKKRSTAYGMASWVKCNSWGPGGAEGVAGRTWEPDSSVQSLSRVWLFVTPWTAALQASLSITNSQSPPKPMSIESMMPSNHLILCCPLLLLPSIFPSMRVFSKGTWHAAPREGIRVPLKQYFSLLPPSPNPDSPSGWAKAGCKGEWVPPLDSMGWTT